MMLAEKIPPQCLKAMDILRYRGYQSYVVGGAVRDLVSGVVPHDWDLATDAPAERIPEFFSGCHCVGSGLRHGTVLVGVDGFFMEVTTFKGDAPNIAADLEKRDFTINAMAFASDGILVDPFGGREDLERRRLRATGNARDRFVEDPLRILRALRFASTMDMEIEAETKSFMLDLMPLLERPAPERVREELGKTLLGSAARKVLLEHACILAVVLPEISPMIGFEQHNKYHCFDVWRHTVEVVANTPAEPVLRWAALFHDMGKPATFTRDSEGRGHFYGHAPVSAKLAENVMDRLRFDKKSEERILFLVERHDMGIPKTKKGIRKIFQKYEYDVICQLISLCHADVAGHSREAAPKGENIRKFRRAIEELHAEGHRFTRKDLAVNGYDIVNLGYRGAEIAKELERLVNLVVFEGCENSREVLLARAEMDNEKNETAESAVSSRACDTDRRLEGEGQPAF